MTCLRELPAVPDPLALHRHDPARYPCLLESVARGGGNGRWSLVFAFPQARLQAQPGTDFLDRLDAAWRAERLPAADDADLPEGLPFRGGWFVYLGYELAAEVEPVLHLPAATDGLPRACALRVPAALAIDHACGRAWAVAEAGGEAHVERLLADCAGLPAVSGPAAEPVLAEALVEDDPAGFLDGVARIREYILAGDVFQVNLSRAWRGRLVPDAGADELYARLRVANPAPFAGLARFGAQAVVSSSPERLLRVRGRRIDTRPIAGTRRRDASTSADAALSAQLLAHPKERAEHVMLIDLERNDLGRVCRPGSVRVDELMAIESYAHVHHIVSNVAGELREDVTPGAAIRAVFPGGTITGCPKVRCMQIIAELEATGRGAYTGAFGYLNRDGDLDLNILIRTLAVDGEHLVLRTGAGIVADSEPAHELAETRHKARGLLLALGAGA
ncbi:MAG TPA: aminodeoxychorismate synthase component I [Plasticicumulans sp.]|uniref:aminodeoxychorismate synthase component I n=1 Tax=Plasticicumulans sp. TaxID=2307179 RepID=UPI002CF2C317|nr:aminodeoxychorismate synthase component I [Plasticicumulans sp.]HMW29408.1 aminodeoxychorismate synthase component I [Plasticicumulans sp.]HNF64551.1 aminodeoxychorismate synthase component I [Plasticicumulans sp.]HNG49458.1 aminodeoxychorismate synthase component I [Plasticicumulans sp.]HNK31722.1 aminodeoxychorismate synthase component I [Plasticicumulans sp.]